MVETVTIPLDWANGFPFVSGVNDVTFDVPQVSDIDRLIQNGVLNLGDIEDAAGQAVRDVLGPLDDVADEFEARVETVLAETLTNPDLTAPLEDRIGEAVDDALDLTLDTGEELGETIAETVVDTIGDTFTVTDTAIDAIADAVVSRLEEDVASAVDVNVSGVFGPLTQDLEEGFEDALESLLGEDGGGIPTVDDVFEIVQEAVLEVEPTLQEAGLFSDPEGFLVAVASTFEEQLVDPEVSEQLQETLDDLD